MAKRAFDLLLSALGLVLLAPLLLLGAAAIRLDSPGPAFFRQERVGLEGRLFRIHKFRTMRLDAEAVGPQVTVGADARITRVGHWLRGRRVDELPQLIDVLLGDMSLVGPRPEVPRYVAHYPSALRQRVLSVRPGITDPASLAFMDEAALLAGAADPEREYVQGILPRKLARQAEYAEHATLGSDLRVVARTLRMLLAR
jgi:lipopolysaccharide/colanic/teichoic acid biosynthesis glycosyltransferase